MWGSSWSSPFRQQTCVAGALLGYDYLVSGRTPLQKNDHFCGFSGKMLISFKQNKVSRLSLPVFCVVGIRQLCNTHFKLSDRRGTRDSEVVLCIAALCP